MHSRLCEVGFRRPARRSARLSCPLHPACSDLPPRSVPLHQPKKLPLWGFRHFIEIIGNDGEVLVYDRPIRAAPMSIQFILVVMGTYRGSMGLLHGPAARSS